MTRVVGCILLAGLFGTMSPVEAASSRCHRFIASLTHSLQPKYFPRHWREVNRAAQKLWTNTVRLKRPSRLPALGNRKPFAEFRDEMSLLERLKLIDDIERDLGSYAAEAALRRDSPWRGNHFAYQAHLAKIEDHAGWEREHLAWEFSDAQNRGKNKPGLPQFRPLNPAGGDSNSLGLLNHMLTYVELQSAKEIDYHQLTEYIDRDQKDLEALARSQPEDVTNQSWRFAKSMGRYLGYTLGIGIALGVVTTLAQSFLSGQVALQAEKGDAWSYNTKMWELQALGEWLSNYDPQRDAIDLEEAQDRMRQLAVARRALWLESAREARSDLVYLDSAIGQQELALDLASRHQDERRVWLILSRLYFLKTHFIEVINHPDFEASTERLELLFEDYDPRGDVLTALQSKEFMTVYRQRFSSLQDPALRQQGDPFRK